MKGAKKIGVRLGNWLTAEQTRSLLRAPNVDSLKGRRDRAILALLLGCGLRRGEVTKLRLDHLQQWEERWAIVDLVGKAAHIRTVPVPELGQGRDRRLVDGCVDYRRTSLPLRHQKGDRLRQWHYRNGDLARGEELGGERRHSQAVAP